MTICLCRSHWTAASLSETGDDRVCSTQGFADVQDGWHKCRSLYMFCNENLSSEDISSERFRLLPARCRARLQRNAEVIDKLSPGGSWLVSQCCSDAAAGRAGACSCLASRRMHRDATLGETRRRATHDRIAHHGRAAS